VTPQQISKRVQEGADARFGDTIGRLLLTLRYRHTHQSWRKECYCEYCQFINGQYMTEKMALHQLKKKIRFYEQIWMLTSDEVDGMLSVETRATVQKWRIKALKEHKKELQKEIL
jgi:hypothetical protein